VSAGAALRQRRAETADVIVALGGDGFMLQTLHRFMSAGKPITACIAAPSAS
jgi:NAD kinase